MIPVKEGTYSIVNLNKSPFDTLSEIKYKDLLNKEYSFCLKNIDSIIAKATKLYANQMSTGKVKKFCCDFKILESVCDDYKGAVLV
jgi:protein AbiQ